MQGDEGEKEGQELPENNDWGVGKSSQPSSLRRNIRRREAGKNHFVGVNEHFIMNQHVLLVF